METKRREITGTAFKLIAVITMFIDHIGAGIFENENVALAMQDSMGFAGWGCLDLAFRGIGRMAFPIYCFMLVEGFYHSRNLVKYAERLLFIAVISEVPFDLLFKNNPFYPKYNNVLWELLLALIVLKGIDYFNVKNKELPFGGAKAFNQFMMILIMIAGMLVGYYSHLDYGWAGICAICVMYKLYGTTKKDRMVAFGIGILVLSLYNLFEVPSVLMLIPMAFYNGQRGRDSKALRAFFYFFYPSHILILYLIRLCIL